MRLVDISAGRVPPWEDSSRREVGYPVLVLQNLLAVPKPVEVKPLANYLIWLRYDDGVEGEVDLSELAGRGVFAAWDEAAFFRSVRIASHGGVEWGSELDLCPDACPCG